MQPVQLKLPAFAAGISFAISTAGLAQVPLPVTDALFTPLNMQEVKLGQLLFWDPILSGNKNISCATCHHPKFATGDGVSLALGEGGLGLGPDRKADPANPPEQRIPRNAPALFNLGATEFTTLFHDGRIQADPDRPSGIRTPLGQDMMAGFASVLSAQTMFPVLSGDEMAGHYSENDVSTAVRRGVITGPGGAWDIIAKRVSGIDAYKQKFQAAYPEITAGGDIEFTDISNAIAAFVAFEWRSDQSPFDGYLRGTNTLSAAAQTGLGLFYGQARCAQCHSGPFQTDHDFHAMGLPQFGPGKAARFESHARDLGRKEVTGQDADAYAFRTPSLRNVAKTQPYGHDGAYADLETFLKAHADPVSALQNYDRAQAVLADFPTAQDWRALDDAAEMAQIAGAVSHKPVALNPEEIDALVAFLNALTDPVALRGRLGIPDELPSGLPVEN